MVQLLTTQIIVFIAFVDVVTSLVEDKGNKTLHDVNNHITEFETRRKSKKDTKKSRSTSSSGERQDSVEKQQEGSDQSLDLSSDSGLSDDLEGNRYKPQSSLERKGWRKWHRKCPKCPEDMVKKWRDPSIEWVCGAYQRARRSFKSKCMMIHRNCQDGTMFVEIYKGRCKNDQEGDSQPHGDHFFYEYNVVLTDDSAESQSASSRGSASDY